MLMRSGSTPAVALRPSRRFVKMRTQFSSIVCGCWLITAASVPSTSSAPQVRRVACTLETPALDNLELMLKGGQMGPVDVFERLRSGSG